MNPLLTLYRRYRHIRGYGVHSPYAFMLATEVLSLPRGYAYYDEKAGGGSHLKRALLRYAWRFGYSSFQADDGRQWADFTEKAGGPRQGACAIRVISAEGFAGPMPGPDTVFAAQGRTTDLVKLLKQSCRTGVLFFGVSALIYFPNPGVHFVAYEYRF